MENLEALIINYLEYCKYNKNLISKLCSLRPADIDLNTCNVLIEKSCLPVTFLLID